MRKKNSFRPTLDGQLEERVVLSGGFGSRLPAYQLMGLTPRAHVLGRRLDPPIVTLINSAFDSFTRDYTQARAVYLSTLDTANDQTGQTKNAFDSYTRYRVDLLAQELINDFVQGAGRARRGHRHSDSTNTAGLVRIVLTNVNGLVPPNPANNNPASTNPVFRVGTLGRALQDSTPEPGTSAAAASLCSLAQDQAIESARVGVINGYSVARLSASRRHH